MVKVIKCGLYARVSTTGDRQDPETQLQKLRDYAQERGWDFKEYVDHASGSITDRAGLKELERDIRQRHINVVVVYSLDRLGRSLHHLIDTIEGWSSRGVELISLTQEIDTTTPMGRAFYQFMGIMAELERGIIVERVNAGLDRARREGKRLGRPKRRVRIPPGIPEAIERGELTLYSAAKQTGIPRSTLKRRLFDHNTTNRIVGNRRVFDHNTTNNIVVK